MPGLPPPPSQEPADGTPKPEGKRGAKVAPAADFTVEPEELCSFVERAIGLKGSVDALERDFNGIMGLAHTLRVNPALGLVRRRAARSRRPPAPPARAALAGRPRCRAADPPVTPPCATAQTSVQDLESRYHHFGSNMHEKVRAPARGLCGAVAAQ